MNTSRIRRRESAEDDLPGEVGIGLILLVATFAVLFVAVLIGVLLA